MAKSSLAEILSRGSWLRDPRSETRGGPRIYRPGGVEAAPPPSRGGWEVLNFTAGGRVVIRSPGPSDRPHDHAGTWRIEKTDGRRAVLEIDGFAGVALVTRTPDGALELKFEPSPTRGH